MQKMYKEYSDIAELRIVYINEAHAADSSWPVPYAKEKGITKHTNFSQRCSVAKRLLSEENLSIPCIVDEMDNKVNEAYSAWPDRVFVVRKDGTLGVAAGRGPWGFKPGVDAAKKFLAHFKETGEELEIPTLSSFGSGSASEEAEPAKPDPQKAKAFAKLAGDWEMKTAFGGNLIEATMSISIKDDIVSGLWKSDRREMKLRELSLEGNTLSFKRPMGRGPMLSFEGTVEGDNIKGTYSGPFGELECTGTKAEPSASGE